MHDRRQAVIYLIVAAVLWSTSGLAIKVIDGHPLAILSARSIVATAVFLLYLGRINRQWTPAQVIGALGYAAMQLFFITATKLTTAANAIFLQYAAPLYIALFGYLLLRERPQRADWISMPIIFAGLLLFFGDRLTLEGLRGNVLAIFSGMAMAVFVLSMRSQKAGTPADILFLGSVLSALVGLPWLIRESWSPSDVGIVLYLGVFQIGLAFVLYSKAIKKVQALESTIILTLEPILNPLWVFLVIGEVPGRYAVIGALLVLGAAIGRAISSARGSPAEPG